MDNPLLAAFLGCLFALTLIVLIVYTLIKHVWLKSIAQWYAEQITQAPPGSPFLPPDDVIAGLRNVPDEYLNIVYTCSEHGRCDGCPLVLAQFEAIATHQGVENMHPAELKHLEVLRAMFSTDPAVRMRCPRPGCSNAEPHNWSLCSGASEPPPSSS